MKEEKKPNGLTETYLSHFSVIFLYTLFLPFFFLGVSQRESCF